MARADVAKFETMMRDDPAAYWRSPVNQQAYHDALAVIHEPPAAEAAARGSQ
jgi:hypothetical protein